MAGDGKRDDWRCRFFLFSLLRRGTGEAVVVVISKGELQGQRPPDALRAGAPTSPLAGPSASTPPMLMARQARPCLHAGVPYVLRQCCWPDGHIPHTDSPASSVQSHPYSRRSSACHGHPRFRAPAGPRLAPHRRLGPALVAEATSCGGCAPPADALLPARPGVHCILRRAKRRSGTAEVNSLHQAWSRVPGASGNQRKMMESSDSLACDAIPCRSYLDIR